MIIKRLRTGVNIGDQEFDSMYTNYIKSVSETHFTPVEVAKAAAVFLAEKAGTRVLDIGSGAGKFCMVGAACTHGHFTGVEQRESLFTLSRQLCKRYGMANTAFIHSNITQIEFQDFDAVYFFNSFFEHVFQDDSIDDTIKLDKELYHIYSITVKEKLEKMRVGTRLATYFSYLDEVPDSYKMVSACFDEKLKFWEKAL